MLSFGQARCQADMQSTLDEFFIGSRNQGMDAITILVLLYVKYTLFQKT